MKQVLKFFKSFLSGNPVITITSWPKIHDNGQIFLLNQKKIQFRNDLIHKRTDKWEDYLMKSY